MKIFSKIFNKNKTEKIDSKIETKESVPGDSQPFAIPSYYLNFYNGKRLSVNKAIDYYISNPTVSTCVDLIAEAVEYIEPVLKIDNNYETDHELIDLLKNPNGFESWTAIIGNTSRFLNLTGNSYLLMVGNYKYPPQYIYSTNPTKISVIPNIDSYPDSFFLSTTGFDGDYKRFENRGDITRFLKRNMSEIYQLKYFSTNDNLEGDSPLNSVYGVLEYLNNNIDFNSKFLKNGGRPSAWLNFRDAPNVDVLKARKRDINDQLTGVNNAGKMLITASDGNDLSTGVDFQQYSANNRDMQSVEMIRDGNLMIFNRYRIPLPFITTSGATFSNVGESVYRFYQDVIIPHIEFIFADFSKCLIPKYKDLDRYNANITFNPDKIPALVDKMLNNIKLRKEIGIETVNELRSTIPDRKPVDGGDEIIISGSSTTLSQVNFKEDFNEYDKDFDENEDTNSEETEEQNTNIQEI